VRARVAILGLCLLPVLARADRGALTLDVGGGGAATFLQAPAPAGFTTSPQVTPTTAPAAVVGVRYALTNGLEIALSGFFQPAVSVFHNGVTLTSAESTPFPGTLAHGYGAHGGAAGVRLLWGLEWRLTASVQFGWTRRVYSGLQQVNDRISPAVDYRLGLDNLIVDSFSVAAACGVEWVFSDAMSISVLPRLELLPGRELAISVVLPITVAFSWYL